MQLMHITQVVALFITVKALENFHYGCQYRLNAMKEGKASEHNLNAFKLQFEEETSLYKKRTIKKIITAHGSFFDHLVSFDDWSSAMGFLEKNRQDAMGFITEYWND